MQSCTQVLLSCVFVLKIPRDPSSVVASRTTSSAHFLLTCRVQQYWRCPRTCGQRFTPSSAKLVKLSLKNASNFTPCNLYSITFLSYTPVNIVCIVFMVSINDGTRDDVRFILSDFQDLPGMSTKDHVTLCIVKRYLDFKVKN